MARFDGPVRFRFNGDPELARQYMALGRKYLGELKQQMERGNLAQLSRTIRSQDGTSMQIYSGYGENRVEIFREEPEVPIEPELGGTFVTTPASKEAPLGWGEPFFDGNGDPINPPLGTPNGGYPQTLLTWVDPNWGAKRYPQYSDKWPSGIEYGNNSWAGNTVAFKEVAISWKSEQRYRDWGFLFNSKFIYYDGFILCNAKQFVIGAAVSNGNLIVLSATQENTSGRLATWHFRPFKPEGYDNDDDYNEVTNPDGWRECSGDFQENFAREDARQPLVFSPDGQKAACSFVELRPDYGTNKRSALELKLITYNVTSFSGQVTIVRMSEYNPYDPSVVAAGFASHTWNPEFPRTEVDRRETPSSPSMPVYHEYNADGVLAEFGVFSASGLRQVTETFDVTAVSHETEVTSFTNLKLGISSYLAYQVVSVRRTEFGVEVLYEDNNVRTAFIDGNVSLGYFLAISYKEARFPAAGTTKALLIGPGVGALELFSVEAFSPVPIPTGFIGVLPLPTHSPTDPNFSIQGDVAANALAREVGEGLGIPDQQVDSGFTFYFAAHRNANDQIIVTAWVRWDRGVEVLFGAYDFITNGNLPQLTKVQGENQRHQNTGVI